MSVDLVAAEEVVHRRGPIAEAVALSVRLPGSCRPGGSASRLHVDGGVLDNLPIGVMAAEREGPVLGVDVAEPFGEGAVAALPHIVDTVSRAMTIGSWRRDDPSRALAREVIVPDLGDIGLFDFRRLDDLVERGGRRAARLRPGCRPGCTDRSMTPAAAAQVRDAHRCHAARRRPRDSPGRVCGYGGGPGRRR